MSESPMTPMTPAEVGIRFGVSPKTVTRWAREGLLPHFTTRGGHHRFYAVDVEQYLTSLTTEKEHTHD